MALPLKKIANEDGYARLRDDVDGYLAGTVFFKDKIIHGYPHIKRIFTLEEGVKRNIEEDVFFVEEKIDGYNVRAAFLDGDVVAFTRAGKIEPFASEKLSILKDFFKENPEIVVCGEMLGNTPFTPPTDEFDFKFYVFDFMKKKTILPFDEKQKLIKKYKFLSVPFLGRFRKTEMPWKKLKEIAAFLNKGKKEGMIIKSSSGKAAVKYVTPNSDIEDIRQNARFVFDMPVGFFNQRIFRSSLFLEELGMNAEEYKEKLGEAFYSSLLEGIKQFKKEGAVKEEFRVFVNSEETWNAIYSMLKKSREIEVADVYRWRQGSRLGVRFSKIYRKTTQKLRRFLSGHAIED
ncbi:MAG: RNA ligase [Candidatus Anstonellales archaeon]